MKLESTAKMIEKRLKQLDFDPVLKIERFGFSFHKWIILADGKSSHPKNPTIYVVNECGPEDQMEWRSQENFAVMIAARAVRRRSQSGNNKPEPFLHVASLKSDEKFLQMVSNLYLRAWDEYECDAEIVGRIAGYLFEKKAPIEEIKGILTMNASEIIEKLGMNFIRQSMFM